MEVESTNPDVPTQQRSDKINNPTNEQKGGKYNRSNQQENKRYTPIG